MCFVWRQPWHQQQPQCIILHCIWPMSRVLYMSLAPCTHTHCPHFLGIQFAVQNYVRGHQLTWTNHCDCTAGYRRALHFNGLNASKHSFSFKQNLSISKYALKMIKTNAMQNLTFNFNFIFDNFNLNKFNKCRSRMARSHTFVK